MKKNDVLVCFFFFSKLILRFDLFDENSALLLLCICALLLRSLAQYSIGWFFIFIESSIIQMRFLLLLLLLLL